ncbi:MAG: carboxymuconolactone decarboxylase family protein [Actinomycetes bacterium]
MTDPREVDAPEVLSTLAIACASIRSACDRTLLELARRCVAMLLHNDLELSALPWGEITEAQRTSLASWPTSDAFDDRERAALELTEQFVIDVTGVLTGPLAAAAGALGAEVGPFVQALYLLDVGQRVDMVLSAFVGQSLTSDSWAWGAAGEIPADPMAAIMTMLAAVGRLQSVDPVTKELVRLRGARLHQCRRCQSVRSVAALNAGANNELLSSDNPAALGELSDGTIAALDLVDATFSGPPSVNEELLGRLSRSYDTAQFVEIASYLLRNACNKIPVAFGVDDALVEEGFEYQIIDASGDTVTVDASALSN